MRNLIERWIDLLRDADPTWGIPLIALGLVLMFLGWQIHKIAIPFLALLVGLICGQLLFPRDYTGLIVGGVLGLVLAQTDRTGRRFDFLHPKEPQAARRERAKRVPMIAATIALVVMAGGVWFWKMKVQPQREYLRFLTAEARQRKPKAEAANKFRKLVGDVVRWEKSEAIWLDEMLYVAEALPDQKEAYLTQFSGKAATGRISLKFHAGRNRTPNRIADNLSAMKDEKGKPRYVARTGSTREQKDSRYPFTSQVSAEFYRSVVARKNSKKPRR